MSPDRYIPALRFERLTPLFDPVLRLTVREGLFKRRLLAAAQPHPGERILDLGCGTGTLAIMLKHAEPQTEVIGLDADPRILERAQRKAAAADVEIHLDRGLSNELPYADASFDLVLSSLFFHHLSSADKRTTSAEIARVLKPGGRLHVADWGRPADPLMRVLSLGVRMLDGFEPTRENFSGELPAIFEGAGLTGADQTERFRTAFGTLALYRAERA